MTEFSGEVKSVIYENAQNMYKILLVAVSQPLAGYDDDEIKVTGTFGDLDWVMDTYDVGEAEVVWEAERWHGTGTTRG